MKRCALVLFVTMPFRSLAAQATDSTNTQPYQRSQLAAAALAWIGPGVGHLYAGEHRRGETILVLGSLIFVGGAWAMVDVIRSVCFLTTQCEDGPAVWHAYAQGTLVGVGVAAWAFGVLDAPFAARRQRKLRNRPRSSDRGVDLVIAPRLDTAGLTIGVGWQW